MDIELLSKMIGELIVDHDSVSLPGVGTFFATIVPSTFSDKGYTINPPYRKLSFVQGGTDDNLLVKTYAELNSMDEASAKAVVHHFLHELKGALIARKSISLSGLGRLRATKDNNFFFVSNPDLDIFPDGFGLASVSLKNTAPVEEEYERFFVENIVPAPAAVENTVDPEKDIANSEKDTVDSEKDIANTEKDTVDPEKDTVDSKKDTIVPETGIAPEETVVKEEPVPSRKRSKWWLLPLMAVIAAALALGLFVLIAKVAPEFTDSILYTPEELEIINH